MKPMMFNADMIRAIREECRKTVTRRVIKPQPPATSHVARVRYSWAWSWWTDGDAHHFAPPYHPGEIVYVPAAWRLLEMLDMPERRSRGAKVRFPDGEIMQFHFDDRERAEKWRKYLDKPKEHWQSPYHFPREAARLFLRITGVRVERLQDITEAQANAEGARSTSGFVTDPENEYAPPPHTAREDFQRIWDSTVKPKDRDLYGWAADPWVWVIEFERVSKREASGDD